jgi:hypothetical protein
VEISPSNNNPSNLLGDTKINPSKAGISPSNNNPSNLLGDTKINPSKGDRLRWAEHHRLVKSSKYIAKRLLQRVQNLEQQKTPVREIWQVSGI